MPPLPRNQIARYIAPVAFLAAITVAVLLIRAGLGSSGSSAETTPSLPTVTAPAAATTTIGAGTTTSTRGAATTTSGTTTEAEQFYTVQSGDTLGGIALQFDTTVSQLLELNPGIDPRALHSGQRVRVG
jgi:LysM repeat protein